MKKPAIPFYAARTNGSPWDDPKCIETIGTYTVKAIALIGAFVLALVYDSNWIMVFFAMACVLLGVELKGRVFGNKGE